MATKAMLLDLLLQAQRDEDEFVASLSQTERLNAGAENDWSPKDEIAHGGDPGLLDTVRRCTRTLLFWRQLVNAGDRHKDRRLNFLAVAAIM